MVVMMVVMMVSVSVVIAMSPQEILPPGTTAASVTRQLKVQDRCQWERRAAQQLLVIADWTSTAWGGAPSVLRAALTTWDPGASLARPPVLLEGGFQKFLFAFPHHVTNPRARAPEYGAVRTSSNPPR